MLRTRILLLATLAVPLPARATQYQYTGPVDLALTPYTPADLIIFDAATASASAPTSVPGTPIRLVNSPTEFSLANDLTLTGALSINSSTGFTKSGTATLTLAADSPYFHPPVTLNAGTLRFASPAPLGNQDVVAAAGPSLITLNPTSTLDLNGFPLQNHLNYNGGALVNDNPTTPVSIPTLPYALGGTFVLGGAGDLTFNQQLSSSGPLTKIGPGTLTLTNPANSSNYFGTITVNAGTLRITTPGAFGNPYNNVVLNPTGTLDLNGLSPAQKSYTFNGGTLANDNPASPITLNSSNFYAYGSTSPTAPIAFGGAGDLTVDAYLSSYSAPLIKTGAGTLTLAQSPYTHGVQIQSGTLRITSSNTLPQNGSTTSVLPGGSLDLNGLPVPNAYISLAGGALVNNNTSTPVNISTNNGYFTLTGPDLRFGGAGDMTFDNFALGFTTQSLTKVGTGTLTLGSSNNHSGGTNLLAGTTVVLDDSELGNFQSTLTLTDGIFRNTKTLGLNRNVVVSGSLGGFDTRFPITISRLTGTGTLNKYGTSSLTLAGNITTGPLSIHQGTLITTGTPVVSSVSVSPGATLSLSGTRLYIDVPPATPLPLDAIRSLLQNGRNAGDWLGTGGITSTALSPTSDPSRTHAIAYADAALLPTSYRQYSATGFVDATSVLLRYTYYGDANLDGKLTPDDYALLDRAYAAQPSNPHWTDGDFNYDGTTNDQDYLLLDTAYLSTHPSESTTLLPQRESQFGERYVSTLLASLPEPTPFIACLFAIPTLLTRRKIRPA